MSEYRVSEVDQFFNGEMTSKSDAMASLDRAAIIGTIVLGVIAVSVISAFVYINIA